MNILALLANYVQKDITLVNQDLLNVSYVLLEVFQISQALLLAQYAQQELTNISVLLANYVQKVITQI